MVIRQLILKRSSRKEVLVRQSNLDNQIQQSIHIKPSEVFLIKTNKKNVVSLIYNVEYQHFLIYFSNELSLRFSHV